MDISQLSFETITLENIDDIEKDKQIKKEVLALLAQRIGITKMNYKSRKEILDMIRKFIINRDVLDNIKETIVGESE